MKQEIDFIKKNVPKAACYEQLAEECCELAQACIKASRKLRGENPTDRSQEYIDQNLKEEFTDVVLCAEILDLIVSNQIMHHKLNRFVERLKSQK